MAPPRHGAAQVTVNGRPVSGRAAAIIAWVAAREARINGLPFGRVAFNLSPGDVKPELVEQGQPVKVAATPQVEARRG